MDLCFKWFKWQISFGSDPFHSLASVLALCFSKLRMCRQASTVANSLYLDKYLIQSHLKPEVSVLSSAQLVQIKTMCDLWQPSLFGLGSCNKGKWLKVFFIIHLFFIKSDAQLYDSVLSCAALIRILHTLHINSFFFLISNNMKLKATHSISNF